MASRLPPKKDVAIALLERSSMYVHLDPRRDQVVVPAWLKKRPQLVLQIGLNMPVPIPDLSVDDECVSCTLSFNRSPFFCWIPWTAIYALVGEDGRGMVWPDDIPAEVAAQAQKAAQELQRQEAPKARGHLRAVKDAEPAPAAATTVDEDSRPASEPPVEAPAVGQSAAALGGGDAAPPVAGEADAVSSASPEVNPPAPVGAEPAGAAPAAGDGSPSERAAAEDSEPDQKKRKLPPYLRIVK